MVDTRNHKTKETSPLKHKFGHFIITLWIIILFRNEATKVRCASVTCQGVEKLV